MFSFLEITDGTVATACELTDGSRYQLVSYAPMMPALRDSLLGGQGPYDSVVDTIVIHAMGTTAALAYAAADSVLKLLEQAWRWWQGERVTAVTIRATAQDSTIKDPVVALVRGRAPGAPAGVALPVVFNEYFGKYVIQNIQIQFVRGPEWWGASQSATTTPAAGMPSVLSTLNIMQTAVNHFTPTVVTLSGPLRRSILSLMLGYLIVAPTNRITVIEGESMTKTGGGTATSTADAAAHASGGSVMRLSAAPALLQLSATFAALFAANAYQVAIYAAVRVNGTPTAPITMRVILFRNSAQAVGPTVPIDYVYFGTANIPQPVFLGIIDGETPFTSMMIQIEWTENPITIDIDYVVCVALNNAPDARAVATVIDPNIYTPFTGVSSTSPLSVVYDPQELTRPAPAVTGREATTGLDEPWSVAGDPFFVSKESIMTGLWLATMGTFWRPWDTTSAAEITFTLAFTRRTPYVVPQ